MKFRFPTRALVVGLLGAALAAGCGKTDSDPRPVNVKPDPRLKIAGDGGGDTRPGQPKQGADTGAVPQ
jgi:hypothetical protein